MKRIASAAAAATLGLVAVVGSTGSANAAPEPKTDVSAQECGLSQVNQSYTNCLAHAHYVTIAYFDSSSMSSGTVSACVPPGTTPTIQLIGPFRVAVNSNDGNQIPC